MSMELEPKQKPNVEPRIDMLQIISQRLEMDRKAPDVLKHAVRYAGTYGAESSELFVASFVDKIFAHPDDTHVMIGIGDPGDGKTTLVRQIAALTRQMINAFSKRYNYKPSYASLAWGDCFPLPPAYARSDAELYHTNQILRELKQREAFEAERRFKTALVKVINEKEYEQEALMVLGEGRTRASKRKLNMVFADIPPTGGMRIDIDGKEEIVGILRGYDLLQELVQHTGEFKGKRYHVHMFGVVASPDVQDRAKRNRKQLLQADNNMIRHVLQERGIIVGRNVSHKDIQRYVQEVAPPSAMELFRDDVDEVLIALDKYRNLSERFPASLLTPEAFRQNRTLREQIMAQELLASLLRDTFKVPEEQAIILYNAHPQTRITLHLDILRRRPILELYPRQQEQLLFNDISKSTN